MINLLKNKQHVHTYLFEIVDFILIFFGIVLVGIIGLNHKIFLYEVQEIWWEKKTNTQVSPHLPTTTYQQWVQLRQHSLPDSIEQGKQFVFKRKTIQHEYELDTYLRQKVTSHELVFNTLIPGKRIVIPSINVDAPIVDVPIAAAEKLRLWDFDKELTKWVVKYPFTLEPWVERKGSTLLFWHSSEDSWDHNQYGYVFYKLPKLVEGDEIQVIRNGKLHTYEVDHKTIKWPNQVADEIDSYDDNHYLTLMACYPLLSDAQRILVRAKIKPPQKDEHRPTLAKQ